MSSVVKGLKKAAKSVGRFAKKYWRQIIVAIAVIYAAGYSTVGKEGFAAAAQEAGGGFGGTMSAAGSTMVAGVSSIGGSMGMGQGVNAQTAGGAFANAPAVQGALSASGGTMGATLGTGAAAQSMGWAPEAANAANAARGASDAAAATNAITASNTAATAGGSRAASNAVNAANTANAAGNTGGFWNSQWAGPVLNGAIQGGLGYMNQRAAEQAAEAEDPLSYYGVALKKKAGQSLTPDQMWSGGPMWSADSWNNPNAQRQLMGGSQYASNFATPTPRTAPSIMGNNKALAYDNLENPNTYNVLSREYDPTAQHLRGMA